MADGFFGNPAVSYLTKVVEIHGAAVIAGSQSAPGAPPGPRTISLPHNPGSARSGGFTTGYGNSNNVVADQSEYETVSRMINEVDDRKGELMYNIANDIAEMCQTIFVMPAATPKVLDFADTIQRTLGEFRSATEDMSIKAVRFSQEVTSVQ